ncbi:hypothetical protein K466DRAFT_49524 [Polyporus arcularius HHB13444]|uniref:MYND-type domain-containing protein n=1 Tax=Polyporus arcularius HHB13444 TaxID=1314778 RepID=A0A5C3PVQ9_9APHY|nr:hypothetical protein K466DRAFT_49524 [Polyporus arcularius HHB13444]
MHTSQMLDAALATYRLWGDCELGRQYLILGAQGNPGLMAKILAQIPRPDAPYRRARVQNGREDAHDYRWRAQDLWMASDVWTWASRNQDVRDAVLKTCYNEGCTSREAAPLEFKHCRCDKAFYCGKECQIQKAHWKTHKSECKGNHPPVESSSPEHDVDSEDSTEEPDSDSEHSASEDRIIW